MGPGAEVGGQGPQNIKRGAPKVALPMTLTRHLPLPLLAAALALLERCSAAEHAVDCFRSDTDRDWLFRGVQQALSEETNAGLPLWNGVLKTKFP